MNERNRPRFEVIRSAPAAWHCRFWKGSRIVWSTELYTTKRAAFKAIEAIAGSPVEPDPDGTWRVRDYLDYPEVRITDTRPKP